MEELFHILKEQTWSWKALKEPILFVLGCIFEMINVAIAVIDVVSDILVAVQFFAAGHFVWGFFVTLSITVSNIVYSIIGVEFIFPRVMFLFLTSESFYESENLSRPETVRELKEKDGKFMFFLKSSFDSLWYSTSTLREATVKAMILPSRGRSKSFRSGWIRAVAYLAIFPLAQFIPLIMWLVETSQKYRELPASTQPNPATMRRKAGTANIKEADPTLLTTEVGREYCEEVEDATFLIHRLNKAQTEHLRKHVVFYVETVIESIPQAVVQLLAISFIGEATEIQMISLLLSIFSIVSKGYVVAHSFDLRIFALKFVAVAHDVFSAFFLFSTLLAKDREEEMAVPLASVVQFILPSQEAGYIRVSVVSSWWMWKETVFVWILVSFVALGLFVMFVEHWIIKGSLSALCTFLLRQLRTDGLVLLGVLSLALCFVCPFLMLVEVAKLTLILFLTLGLLNSHQTNVLAALSHFLESPAPLNSDPFRPVEEVVEPIRSRRYRIVLRRMIDKFGLQAMGPNVPRVLETKPFDSHELLYYHIRNLVDALRVPRGDFRRHFSSIKNLQSFVFGTALVVGGVLMGFSLLFGLIFPYAVVFTTSWYRLNAIQQWCFVGTVGSALVFLGIVPFAWNCLWLAMETRYEQFMSLDCVSLIHQEALNELLPTPYVVMRATIPARLIPRDVLYVIDEFLDRKDISVAHMTTMECKELREW